MGIEKVVMLIGMMVEKVLGCGSVAINNGGDENDGAINGDDGSKSIGLW